MNTAYWLLFHVIATSTPQGFPSLGAMAGRFFAEVKLSSGSKVAGEKLSLVKPLIKMP